MEILFNCLFLKDNSVIPIPIYKDDKNNKFVKSYDDERIPVSKFSVALLNDYICKKKKVGELKLWRVNVKKSVIRKNVSTEDIVQELDGKEMEFQELFEEYFQDELNNQNYIVTNIHIIAIIPVTASGFATKKDINAIIDDLRKTFPHIDDVDEPFFRKLAQKLAVIWKRSHDFSLETPNNPYVKLNQSPSIFKIRLPYGVTKTTRDGIDLRLPPFEANTEMIYKNPLYHDPQFQDTVNLVQNKIKKYEQDIIVLAGVSGGGKTSTTFAIAAEHWAIHVDCSHIISDYNNQLSGELGAVKSKSPSFNNIPLQEWALRKLDIVFASRVLILIKMYVEKKIKTPKDWLLAQLYGLDKDTIALIYESLSELSAEEFSLLIRFINRCLNIGRILFIQDEAQCLCRPEFGEYTGSSEINRPWNFLQAYTFHMISSGFEVTHIISGTTMHMSSGLSLVTSVGKFDAPRKVHLVLRLPYLSPDDVIRVLKTVINVDGVSPETLSYLGNILKGRPRNCASFIKMLTDRSEPLKDKDDEFVKTSKKWIGQISNTMVGYLRNTASTLAIGGVDPREAIVDLICCRIINSESAGAELLRHGILPIQSPPFITLNPHEIDSISIKVNGELESYIVMAIGRYLKLDKNATLTDIYVGHILQRLGSPQSFGSELDSAFASAIIDKCGRNVLEELKKWTDDPHFKFPEWITPGMQFVTETNLSKAVPLYDYVNDIYKSIKYHNHAIQPQHHAGSDLVLSLVDNSNVSKNVVLLSLSSAIYDKIVPSSKVRMQAFKACMDFQYMEEKKEEKKKRLNNKKESRPRNKKVKLDYDQYDGEEGYAEIGLTKKFQKLQKKDIVVDDNDDDDSDQDDLNYDLEYDKTLKDYRVSGKLKFAELHRKIADVADKRKCIHILVELPHRALSKRPDIFRYDKKGNLIVIVDDRNVKQVFGEKLANAITARRTNSD